MSLAFPDVQGNCLETDAAYEDAELLLSSILPDARIEHVAGVHPRGGVHIGVAVPRDAFDEALGVLCEAGYVQTSLRMHDHGHERQATLAAPHADVPLTLRLVESGG